MSRQPIDFAALNHALLQQVESLLARWLPAGVERNGRWYVGDFDGGDGESANVNMSTGQWIDNAAPDEDKGGDLISLYARIHNMGNAAAALELMDQLGWQRPSDRADQNHQAPPWQASAPAAPATTSAPAGPPDDGAPLPEPLPGAAPAAARPASTGKRKPAWRAVVPVPPHAPPATFVFAFKDNTRGGEWVEQTAVRSWEYRFEGDLYGHVARFERVNSKGELVKDTVARTWCENLDDGRGLQRWHWKQWEAPRPLYVPATLLSDAGRLPVCIVEGEKNALDGHRVLGHEFDFVSWPGGCKAWAFALWGWLMGRTVYLWPDCDAQRERLTKAEREAGVAEDSKPLLPEHKQPGMQAMVHIGTELQANQGCTVFMVPLPAPGAVSAGWDISDAIAEGWDADQVRAFIRRGVAFVSPNDEARAALGKKSRSSAAAVDGDGGEPDGDDISWRRYLLEGGNGAIKPARENVVLAIDGMPRPDGKWVPGIPEAAGVLAFNDFTNNVMSLKPTPWGTPAGPWDESDELELGNWLARAHWLPPMSRQTLEEAVSMVARRHRYHPARAYFEGLQGTWDGTPRLRTWLARCCRDEGLQATHESADDVDARLAAHAQQDPLGRYLARVGTWKLMAICQRVLQPGCKFDYMMILEGGQGLGKSTLARLLGVDWFADTGLVLGDKDSYQNLQGVLVYEWGELDSLTRSEVTKVKQFISSQKDRFRASFDRRPKDYPRQVVFIGTTNESHYLSDPTGNRRFWPVRVTRFINLDWLRDNLQQMFAEALHCLAAGERYHPTQAEQRDLFDPQQLERTVENALESAIRRYLYDEDQKVNMNGLNGAFVTEITLADLLSALGISVDKQTQVLTKQASAALGRMAWERGRASGVGGKVRPWVYRRPKDNDNAGVPFAAAKPSTGPAQAHETSEATDDCPF